MRRLDTLDMLECLDACPMDNITCAQVCDRATAVGARRRGLPFYVPFRQEPLQDLATPFPGSPQGINWKAFDASNTSFAPWIRASVPLEAGWSLSATPLCTPAEQAEQERRAECHRMCDVQSPGTQHSATPGLGPLPGVYMGWWQAPPSQLYVPPLLPPREEELVARVGFGKCPQQVMSPDSAPDARLLSWQLSPPAEASSFRANHIPVHGQPVAYRQAVPTPLPSDLRQ